MADGVGTGEAVAPPEDGGGQAVAQEAARDCDRRGWQLRRGGLTAAKRSRFLQVLAETSNVEQAAFAGMASKGSFYRLRERDPAFDAAWRKAVAHGYEALDVELLSVARGNGGRGFDPSLAMGVLTRRDRAAASGSGYGRKASVAHVPIRQVWDAIERRLAAIARGEATDGGNGG